MEQGGNQNQLLLHAVRVAANGICQGIGDTQAVGQRSNALDAVLRRNAKNVADVIEVLDAAHELVNVWVIWDVSDDLLGANGVNQHVLGVHEDDAALKWLGTNDGLDKRSFTCAVVADKTVDVARHNVERKVRNGNLGTVLLGEVLDAQHRNNLARCCLSCSCWIWCWIWCWSCGCRGCDGSCGCSRRGWRRWRYGSVRNGWLWNVVGHVSFLLPIYLSCSHECLELLESALPFSEHRAKSILPER